MKTLKSILFALVLLLPVASAFAGPELPPGKWWRRPDLIGRLSISGEQQDKLDGVFRQSSSDLIDLRGEVEKRSIDLRAELDKPQLDREAIRRTAGRLNDARNRLFERELMMLVDMRSVLSDAQWSGLRNMLDNVDMRQGMRQQERQQQRQRPKQ